MSIPEAVSENVKRLRSERQWSQRELGRNSQVSYTTIQNIEDQRIGSINSDVIEKLAIAFKVEATQLIEKPTTSPVSFEGVIPS